MQLFDEAKASQERLSQSKSSMNSLENKVIQALKDLHPAPAPQSLQSEPKDPMACQVKMLTSGRKCCCPSKTPRRGSEKPLLPSPEESVQNILTLMRSKP